MADSPRRPRKPTENIAECSRVVLRLLETVPDNGDGVTAGWIEDKGIGFSEFAIGSALRTLLKRRQVIRYPDGGLLFWSLPREKVVNRRPKRWGDI